MRRFRGCRAPPAGMGGGRVGSQPLAWAAAFLRASSSSAWRALRASSQAFFSALEAAPSSRFCSLGAALSSSIRRAAWLPSRPT